MILAFCTQGTELTSPLDVRFGRAEYFLFFDSGSKKVTALRNEAREAAGGAGALAVQQLVDNGVETVIAPEVGPQALEALEKFAINAYRQGDSRTVEEALTAWEDGRLEKVLKPTTKGLHRA